MKIKLFSLIAFGLLCGSIAYATPIEYIFTNASNFTLGGVSYTGPYLGYPVIGGELTFTISANTDNVFTSGSFDGKTSGTEFILNELGTTTVSFGGAPLATLTDPMALVINTNYIHPTVNLIDEVTGQGLLSDPIGIYNGMTSFQGTSLVEGSYFLTGSIDTSVGPLAITYNAYQGVFSAKTTAAPAVPEPSTLVLLATGFLGFAGVLKRRMFAN